MEKLSFFIGRWKWVSILFLAIFMMACDDDDDGGITGPQLTGNSETYTLFAQSDPNISGSVVFAERDDGITVITISLSGTDATGDHPVHIHANTAIESGGIVLDLNNVDGSTGQSITEVDTLNDGTSISYSELIDFNGYINVHVSSADLATLVAQGDIGQNALTGVTTSYPLSDVSDPNISGTALLAQRVNGTTLVTINLSGTSAGGDHPAHIHENDAATGGNVVLSLTNVSGDDGLSLTNVTQWDDGTAVTYQDLTAYNGHLNVHLSAADLATLIAQGNIGSNAN